MGIYCKRSRKRLARNERKGDGCESEEVFEDRVSWLGGRMEVKMERWLEVQECKRKSEGNRLILRSKAREEREEERLEAGS